MFYKSEGHTSAIICESTYDICLVYFCLCTIIAISVVVAAIMIVAIAVDTNVNAVPVLGVAVVTVFFSLVVVVVAVVSDVDKVFVFHYLSRCRSYPLTSTAASAIIVFLKNIRFSP